MRTEPPSPQRSVLADSAGPARLVTQASASASRERRLPPRRCGLYLDAVDPFHPPVPPTTGGHEAHRETVTGREGSTAHLRGEQQRTQVLDRETDPVAGD